jgi:SMC interacting uncharacterized protein involved in chromosome segregation
MNEQEQEQLTKKLNELKVKLFDAGEQIAEQNSMLNAIVTKLGYKGQDFSGLLALIPEEVQEV